MNKSTRTVSSTRHVRLRMAAAAYFGARLLFAFLLVAIPLVYWRLGWRDPLLAAVAGGVVMVCFLVAYFIAMPLRCVVCSQPVLLYNGQPKHAYATKWLGLSYRAKVAWDVITAQHHHCMYCHTQCRHKAHRPHETPENMFGRPDISPATNRQGISAFSLPPLPVAPQAAPMATIFDPALLSEPGGAGWAPASSGAASPPAIPPLPRSTPATAPSIPGPRKPEPGSPWLPESPPAPPPSSPFTAVGAMPLPLPLPSVLPSPANPPIPESSFVLAPPPVPSAFPFQEALADPLEHPQPMPTASPFEVVVPSVFQMPPNKTLPVLTPFPPTPAPAPAPAPAPGKLPQVFGSGSASKGSDSLIAPAVPLPFPFPVQQITPGAVPPGSFPSQQSAPVAGPAMEFFSAAESPSVGPVPPAPPFFGQPTPPASEPPSKPSTGQPSAFFGAPRPPAAEAPFMLGPVGNAGMVPFNLPVNPLMSKPPRIRTKPSSPALPMELGLPSQTPAPPAMAPHTRPPKLLPARQAPSQPGGTPVSDIDAMIQILQKGQHTLTATFESMIQDLRGALKDAGASPGFGSAPASPEVASGETPAAGKPEFVSKREEPAPLPSLPPMASGQGPLPSPPLVPLQELASPPALAPLLPLPQAPSPAQQPVTPPTPSEPVVQSVPPAPVLPAYPPLYPLGSATAPVPALAPEFPVLDRSAPDPLPSPRRRPLPAALSADLIAKLGSTLAQAFIPPPPPFPGDAHGMTEIPSQPDAKSPAPAPPDLPPLPPGELLPPLTGPESTATALASGPVTLSPSANAPFQIPHVPQNAFAPAPVAESGSTPSFLELSAPSVPAPFSFLKPVGDPWLNDDLSSPSPVESRPMWTRSGGKTSLS